MIRRFSLNGRSGARIVIDRQQQTFSNCSVPTIEGGDGTVALSLNDQGQATFDLEVTW